MVPILRALSRNADIGGISDQEIYNRIATPKERLAFLGSRFRMLSAKVDSTPDVELGHYMIKKLFSFT